MKPNVFPWQEVRKLGLKYWTVKLQKCHWGRISPLCESLCLAFLPDTDGDLYLFSLFSSLPHFSIHHLPFIFVFLSVFSFFFSLSHFSSLSFTALVFSLRIFTPKHFVVHPHPHFFLSSSPSPTSFFYEQNILKIFFLFVCCVSIF